MKEVERVSIGGYAFTLDKDASMEADRYLKELESHYLAQEGGREIMEGIEERMAELLLDRCGKDGVGTVEDIRSVIDVIGRPERIEEDDPDPEVDSSEKPHRRLFRDMENKRIAGVCSGLSNYFNIDVVLLRVLFAALALATFFAGADEGVWSLAVPVVYLILWLAMPAARTAQDRWAMRGDSSSLADIRRQVQSGVREMGTEIRDAVSPKRGDGLGHLLLLLIGIILLVSGVSGLSSVSVLSLKSSQLFGAPYTRFMSDLQVDAPAVFDILSTPWVMALAVLAVVLPLIGLIYGGIQMIFGFKPPKWRPGLVIFVVWLIIIVVLLVLLATATWASEWTEGTHFI